MEGHLRVCRICGNSEPTVIFKPRRGNQCETCRQSEHRSWAKNNPAKVSGYSRRWRTRSSRNESLSILSRVRSSAKRRGLEFSLTPEWLVEKLAKNRCEITGIAFTRSTDGRAGPFSPSLDRRDSSLGYTPDNTQVVVWCYNASKGSWSHNDVLTMARALVSDK